MPRPWKYLVILIALASIVGIASGIYFYTENRDRVDENDDRVKESRALLMGQQLVLCAAADVVKYGSPIQLPGETERHYRGYLAAGKRFLTLAARIDCRRILVQGGVRRARPREDRPTDQGGDASTSPITGRELGRLLLANRRGHPASRNPHPIHRANPPSASPIPFSPSVSA